MKKIKIDLSNLSEIFPKNFTEEEKEMIKELPVVSAGPKIMHADHTITVILNEIDRRDL